MNVPMAREIMLLVNVPMTRGIMSLMYVPMTRGIMSLMNVPMTRNYVTDKPAYWAIQQSWFARVNAPCNLSHKMSREVAAHFWLISE